MISYAQKCAAYFNIIKANPNISANEIGRRYDKTPYGMKKQDRNDFVKLAKDQLKQGEAFKKQLANSNLPKQTQAKMAKITAKTAYKYAKNSTRKAKSKQGPDIINSSVADLKARTLNRFKPNKGDFIDFGY